jgi:hypothetical protein
MTWLIKVWYCLWLDWHDYCWKHLQRKTVGRFGTKWCQTCTLDKAARKREKAARVEERAQRIIAALNDKKGKTQ